MNPYYIPPGEAPLSGLTRNILALSELKQRGDLARMGLDQDAQRMAADQDYRTQTLAQGAEQNALQREKLYAENPTVKPYDSKTHVKARMAVRTLGLEGSGVEKFLDSAQEGGFNNGQVYSGLKTPQMHRQIKKYAQDQLLKNSEVAGFSGSQQEAQLNDILEAIDKPEDYDAFIDGMFPEVAQYNATVEAATVKANTTGQKSYKLPNGQWTMISPGQPIPEGAVPESVGKQEPKTDFQAFYDGMKQKNPSIGDLEISDAWNARQLDLAGKKSAININMSGSDPFAKWAPDEKQFYFDQYLSNGSIPQFGRGDNASRRQFQKEVANYATGKGIDGYSIQVNKADYGALKGSLNFQQKSFNMASSFANNLNGQISKVDNLMKELDRTGLRAVDVPMRAWKTRFVGSGKERVLDSYLTEISNEIGKLSTGSQASVAELSIGAQEKWNKIHDPNLSIKELREILQATRHQADIRMKSLKTELDNTRGALRNVGRTGDQQPSGGDSLTDYLLQNKDKYSQKALYSSLIKAGWKKDDIINAWRSINGR